jgi:hypothetical protein
MLRLQPLLVVVLACAALQGHAAPQEATPRRLRIHDTRIQEVLAHAMRRSPSFRELVATIELLDYQVYVEEGSCRPQGDAGCLHMMPATTSAKNLLIRFDSRQPTHRAAAQLAHELYHAAEIAREQDVVDQASLRDLFSRIGERSCSGVSDDCWETRAAVAFEALVLREIVSHRSH